MSRNRLLQTEFLKPRYWATWLGIAIIRVVCLLPLKARWLLGSWLGLLAYRVAGRRRRIVEVNIALCFPALSEAGQRELVLDTFRSSGMSIMETATAWFIDPNRYRDIVDIEGEEILRAAKAEGKGVLLLGMHLSTLDFCGALLSTRQPFDVMYRYNKNRLLEAVMTRGRKRNFDSAIERNDVKQVIRRLKQGAIVWYGPDQDYGRKHSVFAPFFSHAAASITATARIARITGCNIVVFSHYRHTATGRYSIHLKKLADYPTGDDITDCTTVNNVVENAVMKAPEQYWWVHRRFKTRPEGKARLY